VVRTDRSLVYYEDQLNRARLWDLLAIYSYIDRDIGYCQGVNSVLIFTFRNAKKEGTLSS
jgi:Rab-GTPase-TBC domain